MEKPEKIGITYLSYKDFINNYNNDFKEWSRRFPDGQELDYLQELDTKIKETLSFFDYIKEGKRVTLNHIAIILVYNELDYLEDFKISFDEYANIIERRINFFCKKRNEKINLKNANNFLNNPFYMANGCEVDTFFIEYPVYANYVPFLKVVENLYDDWNLIFNEDKFKNFELSINRVLKFIETRKVELSKPQPTPVISEEPQPENIKPLQWKGTPTELTELIQSLIECKLLPPELTQREIYSRFKVFFNMDFDHENIKKKIRQRTKDLTPLLEKLMLSMEQYIHKDD